MRAGGPIVPGGDRPGQQPHRLRQRRPEHDRVQVAGMVGEIDPLTSVRLRVDPPRAGPAQDPSRQRKKVPHEVLVHTRPHRATATGEKRQTLYTKFPLRKATVVVKRGEPTKIRERPMVGLATLDPPYKLPTFPNRNDGRRKKSVAAFLPSQAGILSYPEALASQGLPKIGGANRGNVHGTWHPPVLRPVQGRGCWLGLAFCRPSPVAWSLLPVLFPWPISPGRCPPSRSW